MRTAGFVGDGFTFSSSLSSCSSLCCSSLGEQTHGLVIRLAFDSDVVVATALINIYMKCGHIEHARAIFDVTSNSNVVIWNAIIIGYGQFGDTKEAMNLLCQMIRSGTSKPDELTLASVLSSCAHSAMANETTQIHCILVKYGLHGYLSTSNALIIAYAKNGCIYDATRCFDSLSKPDVVSWTSMVTSYAYHGLAKEAIDMFERMVLAGVKPDNIAFLGVLSGCSHAGLVETGLHYFYSMVNDYRIETRSEHYTCLVDLLARSGHLSQAYNVIANMPCAPDVHVLGAYIGACKVHGDIEKAKWAVDRLFSMEAEEAVKYKLMSNVYAGLGLWDDVARVRKMMRDKCYDNGVPGCSWIVNTGKACTFGDVLCM